MNSLSHKLIVLLPKMHIPLYKAEETVKETYSDAELTALLKKPDIRKTTFAEYRGLSISF